MRRKNLFSLAHCKMPLNLQFFAEEGGGDSGTGGASSTGGSSETVKTQGNELDTEQTGKPPYEELLEKMAQLEIRAKSAEAETERQKIENSRLSGEKDRLKDQLAKKMTVEEQLDEAKKEAQEALNKRLEEAEKELAINKATKRYMTLKMDESTAEETARLEFSGDMETVIKNLAKHIENIEKTAGENAISKFLADRPDIKAGNGNSGESLAVSKAKELAARRTSGGVNMDILKDFM